MPVLPGPASAAAAARARRANLSDVSLSSPLLLCHGPGLPRASVAPADCAMLAAPPSPLLVLPTPTSSISTGRIVVPPWVPAARWCSGAFSASPSRRTAAAGDFRGSLGEEGGLPHSAAWKRRPQQQAVRRSNGNAAYTGLAGFMLRTLTRLLACVTNPSSPSSILTQMRNDGLDGPAWEWIYTCAARESRASQAKSATPG